MQVLRLLSTAALALGLVSAASAADAGRLHIRRLAGGNAACGGARVRKPWESLTSKEQSLYVEALGLAIQSGVVSQFSAIHLETMGETQAHHSCGFFGWHRRMLLAFESYLRDLDAKFACLTIPYYDVHTAYVKAANKQCKNMYDCSPIFQAIGGAAVSSPEQTLYFNGAETQGFPVKGAPFSVDCDDNSALCGAMLRNNLQQKAVPSGAGFGTFLDIVTRSQDYATFLEGIQYGIHNEVHNAVGGAMATFASPRDVFFYSWHSAIDMFLTVFHECELGSTGLTEIDLQTSLDAFTQATQSCGGISGVGAESGIVMNVMVDGQLVDASQHPTLGKYFTHVGDKMWNYGDTTLLDDYSYTYELPAIIKTQVLSNRDICKGLDAVSTMGTLMSAETPTPAPTETVTPAPTTPTPSTATPATSSPTTTTTTPASTFTTATTTTTEPMPPSTTTPMSTTTPPTTATPSVPTPSETPTLTPSKIHGVDTPAPTPTLAPVPPATGILTPPTQPTMAVTPTPTSTNAPTIVQSTTPSSGTPMLTLTVTPSPAAVTPTSSPAPTESLPATPPATAPTPIVDQETTRPHSGIVVVKETDTPPVTAATTGAYASPYGTGSLGSSDDLVDGQIGYDGSEPSDSDSDSSSDNGSGSASDDGDFAATEATTGKYWEWVQTTYAGLVTRFDGNMKLVAEQLRVIECLAYDNVFGVAEFSDEFVKNFHLASSKPVCGKAIEAVASGNVTVAVETAAADFVPEEVQFAAPKVIETVKLEAAQADAEATAGETAAPQTDASYVVKAEATLKEAAAVSGDAPASAMESGVELASSPTVETSRLPHKLCH